MMKLRALKSRCAAAMSQREIQRRRRRAMISERAGEEALTDHASAANGAKKLTKRDDKGVARELPPGATLGV